MFRATSGDLQSDPQPTPPGPGVVAAVTPVGVQLVWTLFRSPGPPLDFGEVDHHGNDLPLIAGIRSGRANGQRHAAAIHHDRVCDVWFSTIHGLRSGVLAAAEGPHAHAVDDHRLQFQRFRFAQQCEQMSVQPIPDSERWPAPQFLIRVL